MHFAASDGGGSVSIWDHYDVDDRVEVSGQTLASFGGGISMGDSRKISGPGNVYAVQGYTGSGGYTGASYIYAQDATQTLALGNSHLTPASLGVVQDVSIDGAAESAVVSTGDLDERSAMQHAFVFNGSLDSVQTIEIDGGIATSQDTQMVGSLPTAFGTAGYMNVNVGPTNLKIEGEGAAVGVSSYDSRDGISEVDCSLATGTENSAWAYGNIRSATSDRGEVGAGAGAGNIDFDVDWTGGLPGLYIDGEAEAAGIGVAAVGKKNVIRGTLAASTGDDGMAVSGQNVEASNRDGIAVAAAAAGGLGADISLQQGIAGGGAEAAAIGVAAVSENKNVISAGTLAAATGPARTGAFGEDIEASSNDGFVVAAAAAGGLGAGVNFQNGLPNASIGAGAEAAVVGVAAVSENKNVISAGTLAAATGPARTGAFGEDIEASSNDGFVVAAAAAGGLGAGVNLQNGTIGGGAEAALVGVAAVGEKKNEIGAGTLAAGTGRFGTGACGEDIEASNKEGFIVALAGAGGLGGTIDLSNGNSTIEAEGAIFGVGAAGEQNQFSVGGVVASTGNGAGVVAVDVEASSCEGAAGTGAAAGNVQLALAGGTATLTAEGSATGAGAVGFKSNAWADRMMAKSGDSTAAAGKNLGASVVVGDAGAGAIAATYDSGSGWKEAWVEGDTTSTGSISGDFRAETGQSATAKAKNLHAEGPFVHLGSHADDGMGSTSDADTELSGYFDGRLKAYAGDSTLALQKGRVDGFFDMDAEAKSLIPPFIDKKSKGPFNGIYDIKVKAWTDGTGPHTKAKKEKVI
jgi:hypothetical protein